MIAAMNKVIEPGSLRRMVSKSEESRRSRAGRAGVVRTEAKLRHRWSGPTVLMVGLLLSVLSIRTALGETLGVGPDNWVWSGGIYWAQTGWKLRPNQPLLLTSVTREAASSVVGIRVYDTSRHLLAEASISGAVATFSPGVPLAAGDCYHIVGYATATNNNPRAKHLTLPIRSPALDIMVGINNAWNPDGFGSEDPLVLWDILSIDYAIRAADTSEQETVYFNDFETVAGNEWSSTNRSTTPAGGRRFLGQFGNDTAALSLANLPAHSRISISFDLFVINSWQGNSPDGGYGPDYWDLFVLGGPQLLHTTFSDPSSTEAAQSYPSDYTYGNFPPGTSAAETNTLGYTYNGDTVYRMEFSFPHSGNAVMFNFRGSNLEALWNESWGLDNVAVSIGEADTDGDGVPDAGDQCPNTPAGEMVNAAGCSISQLVPTSWPWRNHGEYVSAVAQAAADFAAQGTITRAQQDAIVAAAARSDVGKKR
jgi:hypothetical protein